MDCATARVEGKGSVRGLFLHYLVRPSRLTFGDSHERSNGIDDIDTWVDITQDAYWALFASVQVRA